MADSSILLPPLVCAEAFRLQKFSAFQEVQITQYPTCHTAETSVSATTRTIEANLLSQVRGCCILFQIVPSLSGLVALGTTEALVCRWHHNLCRTS